MATAEQRDALADWQKISYGDTEASRAAVAYYRERGWAVDDPTFPKRTEAEDRIYPFMSGFKAAQAVGAAALARVAALEQQARTRELWLSESGTNVADLSEERDDLAARVAALETALRTFGRHTDACQRGRVLMSKDCTCGLFAALGGAQ